MNVKVGIGPVGEAPSSNPVAASPPRTVTKPAAPKPPAPPPVNKPPVASFTYRLEFGGVGTNFFHLSLNASASSDDHGIQTYAWVIGGGGTEQVEYGETVSASWYGYCPSWARLTVTDGGGLTDDETQSLTRIVRSFRMATRNPAHCRCCDGIDARDSSHLV